MVKNETPFNSVDEFLIAEELVNRKEYDQLMERGPVTGTITCPDGSKVEVSEANNYKSIRYPISQPGTYTFTAVASNGVVSKIDIELEAGEYTLESSNEYNADIYLKSDKFGKVNITSENKPKAKYTVDSVEQEVDLTEAINEDGTIEFWNSKLGVGYYENVEVTVEIDGKQIKWVGTVDTLPK